MIEKFFGHSILLGAGLLIVCAWGDRPAVVACFCLAGYLAALYCRTMTELTGARRGALPGPDSGAPDFEVDNPGVPPVDTPFTLSIDITEKFNYHQED